MAITSGTTEIFDREFYTREYDRIGTELVENESMGEGRVALYLGIWSATVAGIAAVVSEQATVPAELALAGLLVVGALGVVTTVRIAKRNYRSDALIDSLSRIRRLLYPHGVRVDAALPWDVFSTKPQRPVIWHAGLLQVLYLANAVVPTLAGIVLRLEPLNIAISFVAVMAIQLILVFSSNQRDWVKRKNKGEKFEQQLEALHSVGDSPPMTLRP